jgi:superfamily II DNA or RNA helicase
MSRLPVLSFDRGTLLLHPPPRGKGWIAFATWDDRVEKFRIPAEKYKELISVLREEGAVFEDKAQGFVEVSLALSERMRPYAHQTEALAAWQKADCRGVVVLPTASGKTYLAQMAMVAVQRSTLIVVPTLDLMHQWYANLLAAFPGADLGLLGGGSRDQGQILVATYDSAAIHAESIGNRYGLMVFDECHHLPGDFYRMTAEYALSPFRLGLTATPERADGKHADLDTLIGPVVYRRRPEELAGGALAEHKHVQLRVQLTPEEQKRYTELIALRNQFLQSANIFLGSSEGWQLFIQASARSAAGRRAMLAHNQAKAISQGTESKVRLLGELLARHWPAQTLIFTHDNATVHRISQTFLIPAITHQTAVKERHSILADFRTGHYRSLVASQVLNEGVDVPEASVAIILSGTASEREYVQRLGRVLRRGSSDSKLAYLYELIAEDTAEEGTVARRHRRRS